MALKNCKECSQEISSSAKKCPNCGKDQRNWFMKHKILSFIGILVLIGIIGSVGGGGGKDKPTVSQSPTNSVTSSTNTPTYSDGIYLVGKDIKSGLYKVTLKDTAMKRF